MIDRLLHGGTESQLVALIRHLDRARISPHLCLLDGEDAVSRSLEPSDCPVLRLGIRSFKHPSTVRKAWQLFKFLRRQRMAILQVYFPDSTYLGTLVGRAAGVPYIIRTRNNIGHWLTPKHCQLGRMMNHLVTGTIANCEACRDSIIKHEKAAPASVVVVENSVDVTRFAERSGAGSVARNGRGLVGAVANLRPVKGVDVLVEAAALLMATHPDVHFQIAGEGESRKALELLVKEKGLTQRFALLGTVTDIPRFMTSLDVAVLPSRAEGMPNAVLEYMAAGLPIVATSVGGTVRLIDNGVHGLLVPPESPAQLARAISRLLEDRDMANRLATAARRRAHENYAREKMVQTFQSFYEYLVRFGTLRKPRIRVSEFSEEISRISLVRSRVQSA